MKHFLLTLSFIFIFTKCFSQLVYSDVAPIFINRCASCHHTGGGAPFSLTNYSQADSWSGSIAIALNNNLMPPWQPDTNYTRFLHEKYITASEKAAILSWITTGNLQGDTTLAQTAPVYPPYQLNGTATMTLQIPTYTSTASSADIYCCFSLPTGLTQDRYLRALELIPGNPAIVHHAVVTCDTTGSALSDLSGNCFTQPGQIDITAWAQGTGPSVFPGQAPLKSGMRIKAGSNLVIQIHYPSGSAGLIDSTKIRLYFYPVNEPGIRPINFSTNLQNWTMAMPPNMMSYYNATDGPLGSPVSIFAAWPHSHTVAKTIINYAYSGTDTIPLIKIDKWNFEWEQIYIYPFMKKIPAGYTLFSRHGYDNTVNNPNNPHNPPQWIFAGTSTTDEMLFDSFQWFNYQPGDELIDIAALLDQDTLLHRTPAPSNPLGSFAYPNPSREGFNLGFTLSHFQEFTVTVMDISGRVVFESGTLKGNAGANDFHWNGASTNGAAITGGIYIYTIKSEGTQSTGRLIRQ